MKGSATSEGILASDVENIDHLKSPDPSQWSYFINPFPVKQNITFEFLSVASRHFNHFCRMEKRGYQRSVHKVEEKRVITAARLVFLLAPRLSFVYSESLSALRRAAMKVEY